jgi:PAS domain S-box-containing protein
MTLRSNQRSLRAYLLLLSTALLLPVVAFASVLLWRYAHAEQARYEQEARTAAQRLMAAVDLELSRMRAAADVLAASRSLDTGDYAAFHRQAVEALRAWSPENPTGIAVIVRDRAGQQVVNTRLAPGQPLPRGANPQIDQEVIATKRASIQDLFVGAQAARPIISIRVPVFADENASEVSHVLSLALDPDRFVAVVLAQKLPGAWVGTVVDGESKVVARSTEQGRYLGQLAPAEFRAHATGEGGVWRGENLEGVPVLGAFERSRVSHWRAFVGVPLALAEGQLHRSLWMIAGLGLLALTSTLLFAIPIGHRLTRSVRSLAASAHALARGGRAEPLVTGLSEVDDVAVVLRRAAEDLDQRERALRASEGRLRATHENAAVGIVEINREGRFTYVNEAQCRLTGHTRDELLGRQFWHATHPSDLDQDRDLFTRQVRGEFAIYTLEKKHVRVDGTLGWARVSSTAVRDPLDGSFMYAVRVVEDITARKGAETRQQLLIDELNHRVKNTLATVQSLAYQTFRQALPPEIARQRFEARLMALSRTHNLLNESHWTGASLRDVLALELEPFAREGDVQFEMNGPDVDLPARTAVVLGMVVHELATNAVKYGALSSPEGRLRLSWCVREQDTSGEQMLSLSWREDSGPKVTRPERMGFGSRLVKQAITHELGGEVEVDFTVNGVHCSIAIPLDPRADLKRDRAAA